MSLSEWHRASGLTVSQAAEKVGVHRVTYHAYLSGRKLARPDKAARIQEMTAGAVTPSDLYSAYQGPGR